MEKLFLTAASLSWKKKVVFTAILFFVLAPAVHYNLSFKEQTKKRQAYSDFIRQEAETNIMYEKLLAGWSDKNYADSNKECSEIAEYEELADMDTREMSVNQMKRVKELHRQCAYLYPNLINFGLTYLEGEISKLSSLSGKITSQKEEYWLMEEISSRWRKMESLLEEEYKIFKYNTDIKISIWDTEIEYASGKINIDSRNKIIEGINKEIVRKNGRYARIQDEKNDVFEKKGKLVKKFKSKVGYVEMPSLIKTSGI